MKRIPQTTRASGFTLLELLVVLVIIGIVSSFAVLSTGLTGRNRPLDKEAQRMLALMKMAGEESVQKTEELGLTLDSDGYHFQDYDYDQNAWQSLQDDLFRERHLPDGVTLELVLEGRPIVLASPSQTDSTDKPSADSQDQPKPPQILFLSSGEVTQFTLTLSEHPGTAQRVIKSVGDGSFTLSGATEPAR